MNSAREALEAGFSFEDPVLHLHDVIEGADLVAYASVAVVDEPQWNSSDGHDWQDEFEAAPQDFVTIPFPVTRVTLVIREVVFESGVGERSDGAAGADGGGRDGILTEGTAQPEVRPGDEVHVWFKLAPGTSVIDAMAESDVSRQRLGPLLVFLDWSKYPGPTPDESFDTWRVRNATAVWVRDAADPDLVSPTARGLQAEIIGGIEAGQLVGSSAGKRPSITRSSLEDLIHEESRAQGPIHDYQSWREAGASAGPTQSEPTRMDGQPEDSPTP